MSKTHVPLDQITDNPHQSRLDASKVEGLAETILEHGLRQLPEGRLLVEGEQPDSYSKWTNTYEENWILPGDERRVVQLASGHRRVEAVRMLRDDDTVTDSDLEEAGCLTTHSTVYVPVDLQRISDEEMLDLVTIENVQREGLSPIEEARLINEHAEAGRSNEEIGELFDGRSASWVSNRKRLLNLPEKMQNALHEDDISTRQAQAILPMYELSEDEEEALRTPPPDEISRHQIAQDALGGRASSWIRKKVKALKEHIETVLNPPETDEEEDFSPDVGTTHPQAVGPEYPSKTSNESDETDRDSQEDPADTVEASGAREAEKSSASEMEAGNADRSASTDEGQKKPSPKEGGPAESIGGDGAPPENEGELIRGRFRKRYEPYGVRITEETLDDIQSFGDCKVGHDPNLPNEYHVTVETHEGTLRASYGDWIFEDSQGRHYPIENEEVRRIYEVVGEATYTSEDSPDIGQVVPGQVDTLLSADGEDMWDEAAAEMSTIPSLLVAHRVAGQRQETWRTELIAEAVKEQYGQVTEDDVPDDVMQDVRDEVERRLTVQA